MIFGPVSVARSAPAPQGPLTNFQPFPSSHLNQVRVMCLKGSFTASGSYTSSCSNFLALIRHLPEWQYGASFLRNVELV